LLIDPSELRRMRELAGLTQSELAKRLGVSQSLIAKIEKGRIDPKLSLVRRIMEELTPLIETSETASTIMHSPVIVAYPDERIQEVVERMEKFNISQLPIVNSHGKLVGMIYDYVLMKRLASIIQRPSKAIEVVAPLPPLVSPNTPVNQVMKLLTKNSVTLVVEEGLFPLGIITRSDLIAFLIKK
jgi:predicted transcriptional regulator